MEAENGVPEISGAWLSSDTAIQTEIIEITQQKRRRRPS